jgi:two-component system, OmpR family, sensor histidine kinase ArlS
MNLKQRFSIIFSLLFSALLGVVLLMIFSLFSQFRKEDFEERLQEKAITSIKLLVEVKEVDYQLLKIIDRNTIHKLYNEKILIFNDSLDLIYSSIDDAVISWDLDDLKYLRDNKTFFKRSNEYDVYGMYYDSNEKDYFALVTAEDKYGNRKLDYLKYLLLGAFFVGATTVWILSFYLSKKSLLPLDIVRERIQQITDNNLNIRLPASGKKDEIDMLSGSFNQMLDRIEGSYKRQREFASNASHELRTPITRIVTQLENVVHEKSLSPEARQTLRSISGDTYQLSDVVTSLLILSRIDEKKGLGSFQKVRLDESVFACSQKLSRIYPDYKLHFEIENNTSQEISLEIEGDEVLLGIAITNLLKNAYLYSDNQQVLCTLRTNTDTIELVLVNSGETPSESELTRLFQAFKRGSNTDNKPGSGLGLGIVQRILQYHGASITYKIPEPRKNEVVATFKI